ncbi:phosphatase YwpJ [Caldalkalibacillus thermarum]|uniref:Cof-type HAD-IIB family hydrolase n=1 Tax=Caldalkalibacillus thermarum TaxID=296745 RepID=UPI001667A20A|nr:Cof-type HAD-IIB family hydrolase [Caldalkalibacillus thermarum]GGK26733.1 phosphatase YwpJ [Caldalkalibacillus thermarum]
MKLVAIDLDGTLLNPKGQISEENACALRRAEQEGLQVIIATGRSYPNAKELLAAAGLHPPIISVNGALLHSEAGKLMACQPLPGSVLKPVWAKLAAQDIYLEVYTNRGIVTKTKSRTVLESQWKNFRSALPSLTADQFYTMLDHHLAQTTQVKDRELQEMFTSKELEVYKLLLFSFDQQQLKELRQELIEIEGLNITSSDRYNLELTSLEATKGKALKKAAHLLRIPLSEVVAIGDNLNDVSMLQIAGFSVAMGNAAEEVKQICDFITLTNDQHGVAHVIDRLLGGQLPRSRRAQQNA